MLPYFICTLICLSTSGISASGNYVAAAACARGRLVARQARTGTALHRARAQSPNACEGTHKPSPCSLLVVFVAQLLRLIETGRAPVLASTGVSMRSRSPAIAMCAILASLLIQDGMAISIGICTIPVLDVHASFCAVRAHGRVRQLRTVSKFVRSAFFSLQLCTVCSQDT